MRIRIHPSSPGISATSPPRAEFVEAQVDPAAIYMIEPVDGGNCCMVHVGRGSWACDEPAEDLRARVLDAGHGWTCQRGHACIGHRSCSVCGEMRE